MLHTTLLVKWLWD